jgi:hypothetical protein
MQRVIRLRDRAKALETVNILELDRQYYDLT